MPSYLSVRDLYLGSILFPWVNKKDLGSLGARNRLGIVQIRGNLETLLPKLLNRSPKKFRHFLRQIFNSRFNSAGPHRNRVLCVDVSNDPGQSD